MGVGRGGGCRALAMSGRKTQRQKLGLSPLLKVFPRKWQREMLCFSSEWF